MGLWTKQSREIGKEWVEENSNLIIVTYTKGHSILHIQSLCPIKIGRDLIIGVITSAGLPIRGIQQNGKALQLEKARETSRKHYGYDNASSSPEIKQKREKTFLERYGVSNPFQHEGIKKKIGETNIVKYGHPNPGCHHKNSVKLSHPHRMLSEKLFENNITHENEVVIYDASVFTKYKAPRVDIMIGRLVVEVFGDYYHANPRKYLPSDLISLFRGKKQAHEIWSHDFARLEKLCRCGYQTMVVWEYDIKHNLTAVIERIQHELSN
jgi:hypothetical protein